MSVPAVDFSAILASAVHDMKNSLGSLLGALDEVAADCSDAAAVRERLLTLRYEGQRVNQNLLQVLALYRIGNAQYSLNLAEHDVRECLEECALENAGVLASKGVEVEIACDAGLMWFFDKPLVMGVINSVVNNAYKYAQDKLRLGARSENGYLVIEVADNGRGYPPEMLQRTAGLQTSMNFQRGSTGLGLYFNSVVANMHVNKGCRGFITTGNDGIGGGGRFAIHLP